MSDMEQEYKPLDEEALRQRDMFGCMGCLGLVIGLGVFFYFALVYAEKWEQQEEEEQIALIKEQERKRIEKNFLERKMATPREQENGENEFETEENEETVEEVSPEDIFRGEGKANLHVENGHVWLEADSDTQFNSCCVILFQMTGIIDASVAEELQEKVSTFYHKTQFFNQRMAEVGLLCMIQMKLPLVPKEEEND